MYGILVALHNITRWLVLVAAVYALFVTFSGWFGKREYGVTARRAGTIFGAITGIQLIIGLLVYFWPTGLVMGAISSVGFGGAMRNGDLRFYVVEHIVAMIVATSLIHIGGAVARRARTDARKFQRASIFYTLGTLLIIASIPWWRPFFPGLA